MNRPTAFAPALLALLTAGCMMPVGVPKDRSQRSTRPGPATRSTPVCAGASETVRGDRLRVNGNTVSAEELWAGSHHKLIEKAENLTEPEYRRYADGVAAQLITDRTAELLLYQQASLRLPEQADASIDRYIDGEIRRIITTKYNGTRRRYEKELAKQGLSLEDARDRLRREVMIASYLDGHLKPKVAEPTRAELVAMFESNREQWRRPERRSMSLIDIRVLEYLPENVNNPTREQYAAARAEARSTIQAIEVDLRNDADFAESARRHSHGLHAEDGGAWGTVEKGSVRERFESAVDALHKLDEGAVSQTIETTDGFFLVRCDEIQPAFEPRFQDVQPELKEHHFRVAYNRLISELIQELRAKAGIEPADLDRFHAAVVAEAMRLREDRTP